MMNSKYQEALIKLVAHNYSTRSEKNEYINTLQELVDKETPMKEVQKDEDSYCPKCKALMMIMLPSYCWRCGQKLEWGDDNGTN